MPHLLLGVVFDEDGRAIGQMLVLAGVALLIGALLLIAVLGTLIGGVGGVATQPLEVLGLAPPRPLSMPSTRPQAPATSRAVSIAQRYLGVPYVFGGSDPTTGLDCSGLVQLVFRQMGVALPRTAQLQYAATERVDQADLQPGDLVFFSRTYADPHDWITHVGIYAGGGVQINAPTEGQVVSMQPVFSGFWGAHFAGGGRVRA